MPLGAVLESCFHARAENQETFSTLKYLCSLHSTHILQGESKLNCVFMLTDDKV